MPSSTAGLCLRAVVVGVVLLGAWQMQQQLQLSQLKQRLLQPHPPPPQHQQRPAADVLAPGPDESFVLNVDQLPRGLPGGDDDYIFLTFASAAVDELLTNWVLHMQRLRLPALVAAMDSFVLDRCAQLRVHALDTSEGRRAESAGADNIRGNPGAFLTIGARKVGAIRAVLQRSGRAVLVSDVDVVWMGDPRPLLSGELAGYEDLRHADVLASSDCLDPALDLKDNGCFHILLDRNTGVVLVRNTTNGAAAMQEWQARTAGAFQAWETDQTAFDDMLRGRGRGHRRAMTPAQRTEWHAGKLSWCSEGTPPSSPRYRPGVAEGATMGEPSELGGNHTPGSRRLFEVARRLLFGLLPLPLIANGHSFFVQQLQRQTGVWPLAVHATYQFEDQQDCAFGKRERFREWGLWALRGTPAEDDAPDENFLVLHAEPPREAAVPWVGQADPHARGRQHVTHLDRFRRRLALGVSLARMLNRTVVLPRFWCYCDKYWSRLVQCTVGEQALGTQPLPFGCPMDHVLPVAQWHGSYPTRKARGEKCALPRTADGEPSQGYPYRTNAWLGTLAARPGLAASSATLSAAAAVPPPPPPPPPPPQWRFTQPRDRELTGFERGRDTPPPHGPALDHGPVVVLPAGSSDVQLRGLLAPHKRTRLLHASLDTAAALRSCVSTRAAATDHAALLEQLFHAKWCWRPQEMLNSRNTTDGGKEDVCVWGLQKVEAPPVCQA